MIKAINLSDTVQFQSEHDPDKGNPGATVFVLAPIAARINAVLKDRATQFRSDATGGGGLQADFRPNDIALDTVRHGLKGLSNFMGNKNVPLEYATQDQVIGAVTYKVVADSILDVIPLAVMRELSGEINKLSSVPEVEAKKSEG